jgi:hypothetical protein
MKVKCGQLLSIVKNLMMINNKIIFGVLLFITFFVFLLFCEVPIGNEIYRNECLLLFCLFGAAVFLDLFILKSSIPMLGLLSFFLLLSFSLPLFFIKADFLQLTGNITLALKYALIGYICFFLGFGLVVFSAKGTRFSLIKDLNNDTMKIRLLALLCLLIYYLTKIGVLSFVKQFREPAILIYVALNIGFIARKLNVSKIEKITFWLVLVSEIIIRSLDGLLAYIIVFLIFVFSILFFFGSLKKSLVIFSFVLLYLIGVFMNPIKHYYRAEVWYNTAQTDELGVVDRFQKILDLNQRVADGKLIKSDDEKDRESFLWRFSYQIGALALVVQQTPLNIPYWNGSTYSVFSKFIPRFLWKDKPKEEMGYKFGTEYGIISKDNRSTSMNTPIVVESYMNFGFLGVTLVMFLIGLVFGRLNLFVNNNIIDPWSKCIHFAILFPTVQHESNFSLVFGGVFLNALFVFLIVKILK